MTTHNSWDRFSDLNKQGFMKSAYKKPKLATAYEVVTEEGLIYSGTNEGMAKIIAIQNGSKVIKVRR